MLFKLPDHDTLYEALKQNDPSYEGRVFVAVKSTGIFCRLTCPARTPLQKNCTFYKTVSECLSAGYRPCKRCHPLGTRSNSDPLFKSLLTALSDQPDKRWSEQEITALGFDPSTVRRAFKKEFGITFLEMSRQLRLGQGFTALSNGDRVIDAQVDAGFESPSAFRTAFIKQFGLKPSDNTKDALFFLSWHETPVGTLLSVTDHRSLHLLEFLDRKALPAELKKMFAFSKGRIAFGTSKLTKLVDLQLRAYFAGELPKFDLPIVLHGTDFTKTVWKALCDIPAGETRSYGELAQTIGKPSASRAVARANGCNQIAIVVPCHRVIGSDGSLTGYGGGLWRKQKLLEIEALYQH